MYFDIEPLLLIFKHHTGIENFALVFLQNSITEGHDMTYFVFKMPLNPNEPT